MEIGVYIAEILKDLGTISIPGIGTLYTKKSSAYFDEEKHIFIPPSQRIHFKLIEEGNTSLFSEYFSKAENISVIAADRIIHKFAANFITELGTTGTAEIEGLGKLRREGVNYIFEIFQYYGLEPVEEIDVILPQADDEDNTLKNEPEIFNEDIPVTNPPPLNSEDEKEPGPLVYTEVNISEPVPPAEDKAATEMEIEEATDDDSEDNPEPIHLSAPDTEADEQEDYIAFRLRQREQERKEEKEFQEEEQKSGEQNTVRQEKEITNPETAEAQARINDIFQNLIQDKEEVSEEEHEEGAWKKWLLITIPILLILTAGLLYFFYPEIQAFRHRNDPPVVAKEQPPAITPLPADSLADTLKQKLADTVKTVKDTSSVSATVSYAPVSYEIIIAAFSQKNEALNYMKEFKGKNANLHIVEKARGTFKFVISAGSFKDLASAQAGKAEAIKDLDNDISKYAWIDLVQLKTN